MKKLTANQRSLLEFIREGRASSRLIYTGGRQEQNLRQLESRGLVKVIEGHSELMVRAVLTEAGLAEAGEPQGMAKANG